MAGLDYDQFGYDMHMLESENIISPENYAKVYQKHLSNALSPPNTFGLMAKASLPIITAVFVPYPSIALWVQAICGLWDQIILMGSAAHTPNVTPTLLYSTLASAGTTAVMATGLDNVNTNFEILPNYVRTYMAVENILSATPIPFANPSGVTIPILVS